MLILSRLVGTSIHVGHDITITVLGVQGNKVRIGINAPKTVEIWREEIYDRIKRKNHVGQDAREHDP